MSTDRHSHEKFLEELARLDEALRRPDESTRPPIAPLDRGFNERRDVVAQSSDAPARREECHPAERRDVERRRTDCQGLDCHGVDWR